MYYGYFGEFHQHNAKTDKTGDKTRPSTASMRMMKGDTELESVTNLKTILTEIHVNQVYLMMSCVV